MLNKSYQKPKSRLKTPGGGGTPHMKGVGMIVGHIELSP